MSDQQHERTPRRPALAAAAAFLLASVAAIAFAVSYVMDAGTQAFAWTLGIAFGALAVGLIIWGRHLQPSGGYVEEHGSFGSPPAERERTVRALTEIAHPHRRGLLGMLAVAALSIGGALVFPFRSLMQPKGENPDRQLARTEWRDGDLRLVDASGHPVHISDVQPDTIIMVNPEGHPKSGDTPSFVVRLDPARFRQPPSANHISGVVAYSLLCTHAGCPVSLYEQSTGRIVCPCHQSIFDLLQAGRAVAGPAGRSLPGLPIAVDGDGFLYATGDFTSPPGPGYWGRS